MKIVDGSILFFSKISLSIFRGYEGYLYWSENGMRRVRFFEKKLAGDLASRQSSREFKPRANRIARLDFLSCSALADVTIHLLCMLHSCASSSGLPPASPCCFAQT